MTDPKSPLARPARVSAKPRVRMTADGSMVKVRRGKAYTTDSFENFLTRTGINAGNVSGAGRYGFNPISRIRTQLEWMYRGSWVVGTIVDCVAEDMTREGVELQCDASPDEIAEFEKHQLDELQVWPAIADAVKWARLYGGACAFIMIDGQDPSTPLDPEKVSNDQFRGVFPLDRWALFPSLNDLVDDMGPDLGNPRFYEVRPDYGTGLPYMKIHYSRMIRMEGIRLPYWQRITENLWGISVIERLYDRLVAFDSATQGTAQMVYKAYLRTYKVEGLRKLIAASGPAFDALIKQIDMIRKYQSMEGLTLMDASDEYEAHAYTFDGLDAVLLQFGQQLSGASQIPLVRLFGQSPAGLNSTGESDLRTYYDGIKRQQNVLLGRGMQRAYEVAWRSQHGAEPPEDWKLNFRPLWQMDDEARAQVASTTTDAIMKPFDAGLTARSTTLKELRSQSRVTGLFTNIDDEMIEAAEKEDGGKPPDPTEFGLDPFGNPINPPEESNGDKPPGKTTNGKGGNGVRPPAQAAGE